MKRFLRDGANSTIPGLSTDFTQRDFSLLIGEKVIEMFYLLTWTQFRRCSVERLTLLEGGVAIPKPDKFIEELKIRRNQLILCFLSHLPGISRYAHKSMECSEI